MAGQVAKMVAAELGSSALETVPEIIKYTMTAPEKYSGLKAVGYGLTKAVPWLDFMNEYPEAHPGYWDPSEVRKLAEITPVRVKEKTVTPSEKKLIQHSTGSSPIPLHAPVSQSYSTTGGRAYSRNPKIWNPFSQMYIDIPELFRLSRKNDSEGLWAKREIKLYKKYLPE